jgi:hypothetical protein
VHFVRASGLDLADVLPNNHFDLAFFHAVPCACADVGACPYPDAAGDFSATDALSKTLNEHHERECTSGGWRRANNAAPGESNPDDALTPVRLRSAARELRGGRALP